ncbi:ABC transporter ATP-binding protein [Nonomuraea sp. NPDC048892]|uniref:ABC transporter ATP-binding protein n=1 Tax=Nonomuraea sp. NPDC048892 TaxID=3154624 RepID=UPI0033D4F613
MAAEPGIIEPARAAPAAHPARPTAIEVRSLVKTYPRGVRALDGISFSAARGEITAVLGPNGAGKSTLIKAMATLTGFEAGSIGVDGVDVRARPAEVRRRIGVVSQAYSSDPSATGYDNLRLQARIYGLRGDRLRGQLHELLEWMDLGSAAGRLVRTYSGGMRRRLELAMGLVHEPAVLVLDEPTAAVDPVAAEGLWSLVTELCRDRRMSVLLTTHQLDEADRLASWVVILNKGAVVVQGSPRDLKEELRGDVVSVRLTDSATARRVEAAMRRVAQVRNVAWAGTELRVDVQGDARALGSVLEVLTAHSVTGPVSVSRPSLNDIYFRHAGGRR